MPALRRILPALLVIFASACSNAPGPATTGRASNPSVITEAELERFAGQSIHEAIRRLRPQFLRSRGPSTITQGSNGIVVYLGTTRMGDPGALNQIRVSDVLRVQYLTPSEASQRFGLDHTEGAIVLTPR